MPYIRQDQADIFVSIDGVPYGDSWYSVEGGNLESDDSKTRAGGMGSEYSLGGPSSRGDVTCTIQLDDSVIGWHDLLETKVKQDAPMKVTYRFLNRLKQQRGRDYTYTGTIKSAFLPDMSTGESGAAYYTVVMSSDEDAA